MGSRLNLESLVVIFGSYILKVFDFNEVSTRLMTQNEDVAWMLSHLFLMVILCLEYLSSGENLKKIRIMFHYTTLPGRVG